MTEPSERNREMARQFLTDNGRYPRFCARMFDEADLAKMLAAAREEGRREAIEECANLVNPGDWPTSIHRECAEEVNDAIRALAKPRPRENLT